MSRSRKVKIPFFLFHNSGCTVHNTSVLKVSIISYGEITTHMVNTLQKLNLKIYLHIIKHDIIPQYNKYPVAQYPISMSNLERKKASKEENDNCAHHHHNLPEIWKVVGKKCKSCDVHKESIERKTKCPSTSFPGSQRQPHVPLVDRLSRVICCFLGIKHYKSYILYIRFPESGGLILTLSIP